MQTNNVSKNEVLAILDTYEGMIRLGNASPAVYAKWTEWKAALRRLGGR